MVSAESTSSTAAGGERGGGAAAGRRLVLPNTTVGRGGSVGVAAVFFIFIAASTVLSTALAYSRWSFLPDSLGKGVTVVTAERLPTIIGDDVLLMMFLPRRRRFSGSARRIHDRRWVFGTGDGVQGCGRGRPFRSVGHRGRGGRR